MCYICYSKGEKLQCAVCWSVMAHRNNVRRHYERLHPEMKRYQCYYCNHVESSLRALLEDHVGPEHGGKIKRQMQESKSTMKSRGKYLGLDLPLPESYQAIRDYQRKGKGIQKREEGSQETLDMSPGLSHQLTLVVEGANRITKNDLEDIIMVEEEIDHTKEVVVSNDPQQQKDVAASSEEKMKDAVTGEPEKSKEVLGSGDKAVGGVVDVPEKVLDIEKTKSKISQKEEISGDRVRGKKQGSLEKIVKRLKKEKKRLVVRESREGRREKARRLEQKAKSHKKSEVRRSKEGKSKTVKTVVQLERDPALDVMAVGLRKTGVDRKSVV